jgi:SAM-dependent methyltransferase
MGLGLVKLKSGRYSNAPDVKRYMTGSDDGVSCITKHMNHMYQAWTRLDGIIRKGRPKRRSAPDILADPRKNRQFICGMFEIGYEAARLIADEVDLSGVKKVADIGGGPAHFPIVFSGKAPGANFVVADYPNTIRVAREYIRKHGLQGRIKAKRCEFFAVEELGIGDGYDLAIISQVLHAASDLDCMELLRKTYRILSPGGRILVNENALDDGGLGPTPPLVFAVNMLVQNEGRTFTVGELKGWLRAAGFRDISSKRLHERSVIITGVRPR